MTRGVLERRILSIGIGLFGWGCWERPTYHSNGYQFVSLDPVQLSWVDEGRLVTSEDAASELQQHHELTLPDSVTTFEFAYPGALDARGAPACRIVVADSWDDAIHVFSLTGRYLHTIHGGASDSSITRQVRSLAIGDDGSIVAADYTWQTIAVYAPNGTRRWVRKIPNPAPAVYGSEVAVDRRGRVIEHWIGWFYWGNVDAWSEDLPLVRIWESQGEPNTIGEIRVFGGSNFTPYLNQSRVLVWRDTLLVVRRSDARILTFNLDGERPQLARTISPAVYFHMEPPVEVVSDEGEVAGFAGQRHVIDASIAPSGTIFMLQNTRFPPIPRTRDDVDKLNTAGTSWEPDRVLAAIGRVGETRALFTVPPGATNISVTESLIVLLVSDADSDRWRILIYANPVADDRLRTAEQSACFSGP